MSKYITSDTVAMLGFAWISTAAWQVGLALGCLIAEILTLWIAAAIYQKEKKG